jgi:WD40 repeat protein
MTAYESGGRLESALKGAIMHIRLASLVLATIALSTVLLSHRCLLAGQPGKPTPQPTKKDAADEKTIRALIGQLGDDSFDRREDGSKRLTTIGEPALKLLRKAAKDGTDAEVRERARQVIEAIVTGFFFEVRHFTRPITQGIPWTTRLVLTPDGRQVVAAGHASLRSWDLASGKETTAFDWPHVTYSWALGISPDGNRVIVGSDDRVARVLDMKTGKLVRELRGHTASIWGAAILAGCKRAVTGAWDKSLRLWDLDSGKELRAFANVTDNVRCLAVSPNGKLIAAGHFTFPEVQAPATLRLWDLETGKQIRAFTGHSAAITSVAFAPDGKTLCSSSFDKTVRLWDVAGGKELKRLLGHTNRVEAAAFTPDGKRVVSCGDQSDAVVRLWDAASGTQIAQTPEMATGFLGVIARPDGRQCVTAGGDGVVRLWQWKR